LKRFFAPDLVFNLGIWLSLGLGALLNLAGLQQPRSRRNQRKNRHGSPFGRAVFNGPPHTRKRVWVQEAGVGRARRFIVHARLV
jgi:hypothetical protein